ncbi:MAG: hypothetical protein ACK5KV_09695, partial [Bacteroides graminisolvens]
MKKLILFIYIFIASIYNLHAGNNETDSLLLELDRTIKERPKYISHKEEILINLKRELQQNSSKEKSFSILGRLLEEYRS